MASTRITLTGDEIDALRTAVNNVSCGDLDDLDAAGFTTDAELKALQSVTEKLDRAAIRTNALEWPDA